VERREMKEEGEKKSASKKKGVNQALYHEYRRGKRGERREEKILPRSHFF